MQLVRTFHPVGHGAFYTEQFYEDSDVQKENSVFTAVYDCGSSSNSLIKGLVTDFVNDSKNLHDGKIDALFISHFHSDHISGVRYLIDKCDKIFLPAITKEQKLALLVQNVIAATERLNVQPAEAVDSDDAIWFIKQVFSSSDFNKGVRSKVVEIPLIDTSSDGVDYDVERIEQSKESLTCSKKLPIGQGVKIRSDVNWIYYPMNLKHANGITFETSLSGVIKKNGYIDFSLLKGVCSSDAWINIRETYKGAIESNVANEYSMTVYSGHLKVPARGNIFATAVCLSCPCFTKRGCRKCYRIDCQNGFYMGDFVAGEENVSKFIKYYGQYFQSTTLMQVPHHGSDNVGEYGYQLYDNIKEVVFSLRFDKYPTRIPSKDLLLEVLKRNICPKIVTEENFTKLILIYPF